MLVAGILLVLHATLAWALRRPGVIVREDDAHFLVLAEALQDFQYRDVFRVDAPPHSQYPPVYPVILAAWSPLVGARFDGFVALNVVLSTLSLAVFFIGISRLWTPLWGLVCLAPLAVNTNFLGIAGEVMSEPAYTFFTAVAVVALAGLRTRTRNLGLAGAAAVLAALTRSIGVAVLAAVVLHWVLERRKMATPLLLGASALTVGAWLLWSATAPEQHVGQSYAADFAFRPSAAGSPSLAAVLVERVISNFQRYLYPTLGYYLAVPNLRGMTLDNVVAAGVMGVALLPGLLMLLGRWRVAGLYLTAYGAVLLIWPWATGRFLLPVFPLLLLALMLGLGWVTERIVPGRRFEEEVEPSWAAELTGRKAGSAAILAFSLALTAWGFARTTRSIAELRGCERGGTPPAASCVATDQASFFDALRFIDLTLPGDAVLLSVKPAPLYYYTRRRTAPIEEALQRHPDAFLTFLRDHGTGYVLLGSLEPAEVGRLSDLLEANCRDLGLVHEFPPRTYLLRLRSPGEEAGDDGCQAIASSRRANVGWGLP